MAFKLEVIDQHDVLLLQRHCLSSLSTYGTAFAVSLVEISRDVFVILHRDPSGTVVPNYAVLRIRTRPIKSCIKKILFLCHLRHKRCELLETSF